MDILNAFASNFLPYDWFIVVLAIYNGILFKRIVTPTNKIYNHFLKSEQLGNIEESAKRRIKANTSKEQALSSSELMQNRKKMNSLYAWYLNLTSMFPLLGMLGTVFSLMPMVNTLGSEITGSFFSALTSTAWGLIAALVFKGLDSKISYKIEDNEKFMDHMLMPKVANEEVAL